MVRRRSNVNFFLYSPITEHKTKTTHLIAPIFRKKLNLKGLKLFPNSGSPIIYAITSGFYKKKLSIKKSYSTYYYHNQLQYLFFKHGNSDFYRKGLKGLLIAKRLKLNFWLDISTIDIKLVFLNTNFIFKNWSYNCTTALGSIWTYLKYFKGHREMNMIPHVLNVQFRTYKNKYSKVFKKFNYKHRITTKYYLLNNDIRSWMDQPKAHSTIKYKSKITDNFNIFNRLQYFKYILFFKNTLQFFIDYYKILIYINIFKIF